MNLDRNLSRLYKLLKIALMGFILLKILSINANAKEMSVYCSSGDYSNCLGLFQGNNATSLNGNVITNYNTSSSYRYFSLTSMPLLPNTSYSFRITYTPSSRSIKNIYYKWRKVTLDGEVENVSGYVSADYNPTWLGGVNVNVATFNVTTTNNYSINTTNFINLDFGSSGVTIKKIEITETSQQNTNDIISKVKEIAQSYTCPIGPLVINASDWAALGTNNKHLDSTGAEIADTNSIISPYMVIQAGTYIINYNGDLPNTYYACTYTANKQIRNCYQYVNTGNGNNLSENVINATNYDAYLRVSVRKSRAVKVTGQVCNNWEKEAQDKANSILDDTNSYLKDDSNPNVDSQGIQNTMNSVSQTNPLEYFLTLPTTLINATLTGLNSNSCTAWKIGRFGTIGRHDLSNYEFTFPCINLRQKLGDDLFLIIDTFVAVGILTMTVVNLYHTISNYITLGAEDEVRSHSSFLSPMDFLGNILGGNAGGVITHMKE